MAIREAAPMDIAGILQIARESATAAHWSDLSYKDAIKQPNRLVLVAAQSDEVLGFLIASVAVTEWELENIGVKLSFRRQGVGRELLTSLIQRARKSGASEIRQEIRASNQPAQRLGQAVGFVQTGRRRAYYRNPEEDALLFNYLL